MGLNNYSLHNLTGEEAAAVNCSLTFRVFLFLTVTTDNIQHCVIVGKKLTFCCTWLQFLRHLSQKLAIQWSNRALIF